MNLELFIKSLSGEEFFKLRNLLKADQTFLEIYDKTRELENYNYKIQSYNHRVEKRRRVSALNFNDCGVLHYLDLNGFPSNMLIGSLHLNLLLIPSISKTTISHIENWLRFYHEEYLGIREEEDEY